MHEYTNQKTKLVSKCLKPTKPYKIYSHLKLKSHSTTENHTYVNKHNFIRETNLHLYLFSKSATETFGFLRSPLDSITSVEDGELRFSSSANAIVCSSARKWPNKGANNNGSIIRVQIKVQICPRNRQYHIFWLSITIFEFSWGFWLLCTLPRRMNYIIPFSGLYCISIMPIYTNFPSNNPTRCLFVTQKRLLDWEKILALLSRWK